MRMRGRFKQRSQSTPAYTRGIASACLFCYSTRSNQAQAFPHVYTLRHPVIGCKSGDLLQDFKARKLDSMSRIGGGIKSYHPPPQHHTADYSETYPTYPDYTSTSTPTAPFFCSLLTALFEYCVFKVSCICGISISTR